jgi:hypothetical protein
MIPAWFEEDGNGLDIAMLHYFIQIYLYSLANLIYT